MSRGMGRLGFMTASGDLPDGMDPALEAAWRGVVTLYLDIRARWMQAAEELRLTPAGLDALLKVDVEDPRPMRELAQRLGCDASFVTAMVDDLEAAGYAERHASATDRRVKNVALTAAGRRARSRAEQQLTAPPPLLRTLSPREQRDLARLLIRALPPGDDVRG